MKQKTINIYEFEELKPEIQEKVLNKFREQEDFYFLEDILKEDLKELLKKNKIKPIEEPILIYSLNYCQGDGLSFEGLFKYKKYIIRIKRENFHYCHKNSCNIYMETEKGNEPHKDIQEDFKSIYMEICEELEKKGYAYIEDALKDDTIKENIEINEYTFRENGEIEFI